MSDESRLLHSVNEAMTMLGLGRSTMKTAIGNGHIRVIRIGRRVMISRDELERVAHDGIPDLHAKSTKPGSMS